MMGMVAFEVPLRLRHASTEEHHWCGKLKREADPSRGSKVAESLYGFHRGDPISPEP